MGIDLNNCPPHLAAAIREADGKRTKRGKKMDTPSLMMFRKPALPAECGQAFFCDPPTVTHHAKIIKGRKLFDSPELEAAVQMLMTAMPHNRGEFCVAGPARCWIQFLFRGPVVVHRYCHGPTESGAWHLAKPDCDNLAKTLTDVMVAREWLENDCQIANLEVIKSYGAEPGICFQLESLEMRHAPHQLKIHPKLGYLRKIEQPEEQGPIEAGVPLTPAQQIEYAVLPIYERAAYLEKAKAARAAKQ